MIELRVDRESGVLITRVVGAIDDTAFVEAYSEIATVPGVHPGIDEVVDLRDGDLSRVTRTALRQIDDIAGRFHADAEARPRTAVLVDSDLSFGVARMYELMAEASPEMVQVFRTPAEVVRWLDRPELEMALTRDG